MVDRARKSGSDDLGDTSRRPLPSVTPESRFFWESGADGRLRFLKCKTCGFIVHPPSPLCPYCRNASLDVTPVSGLGTVVSKTTSYSAHIPGLSPPYVIGLVAIDEQPSVRLLTNLVSDGGDAPSIGARVRVTFDRCGDVWLPLFELAAV
jgi:uncharacterized OB-fold protein